MKNVDYLKEHIGVLKLWLRVLLTITLIAFLAAMNQLSTIDVNSSYDLNYMLLYFGIVIFFIVSMIKFIWDISTDIQNLIELLKP